MNTAIWLALPAVILLGGDNNDGWKDIDDDDGIRVWEREVKGSDVREVKAEAVVALPLDKLWGVLLDVSKYTEFMPYVVEARVVGKFEGGHYEYQLIDPPMVSQRDYTLAVTVDIDKEAGRYKRSWVPANDKGPKLREDVVRVEINKGVWTMTRLGPNKTKVSYYLYTSPGGSIPTWIGQRASRTSVPALVHAIRSRAKDPKWTP